METYLDALCDELAMSGEDQFGPETLYIGGGTPSLLGVEGFQRLVADLTRHVDLSAVREWTMEINPGNLAPGLLPAMRAAGVNRVSIGAQSFDDDILTAMGRRHRVADTLRAVDEVAAAGIPNWGLDLIAAYPGVSAAAWAQTLRQAIALQPQHLSVYDLSIEPGTRMERLLRTGHIRASTDEVTLAALNTATRIAEQAGLRRYEVSNLAIPGRECLHNLNCWRGGDYLGLGPAAASRIDRQRWTNHPDLAAYTTALARNEPPPRTDEALDAETDLKERLIFHFRLTEGVNLDDFSQRFHPTPTQIAYWTAQLTNLANQGLLTRSNSYWRPTPLGLQQADHIAEELL